MQAVDIRAQLLGGGIAAATDLRGCTQREIDDLERRVGAPLPGAYQQFLAAIGHQAGAFLRGTDVSYGQARGLTDAAKALLAEDAALHNLPEDAFVFYMHQGYEFGYFRLGAGEDPPVYQYVEGRGRPRVAWPSFTAYLVDAMEGHRQALRRHSQD